MRLRFALPVQIAVEIEGGIGEHAALDSGPQDILQRGARPDQLSNILPAGIGEVAPVSLVAENQPIAGIEQHETFGNGVDRIEKLSPGLLRVTASSAAQERIPHEQRHRNARRGRHPPIRVDERDQDKACEPDARHDVEERIRCEPGLQAEGQADSGREHEPDGRDLREPRLQRDLRTKDHRRHQHEEAATESYPAHESARE